MSYVNSLTAILLRHGETEANANGIVQGHADTPLTQAGIDSTLKKAEKLAGIVFDHVYCSDLQRARSTVELLVNHFPSLPEVEYMRDLREIDFGIYAGRAKDEIMSTIKHHKANTGFRYPGGESGDDLENRVLRFFAHCRKSHKGQTVLIVSHYGIMETAARRFAKTPPDEPVVIERDDVWRMTFDKAGRAVIEVL